jgi:hypothetical protein
MARTGVIDVLKKHFVICYINMKLSFVFVCILSVNTKIKYTVYQYILLVCFLSCKKKIHCTELTCKYR